MATNSGGRREGAGHGGVSAPAPEIPEKIASEEERSSNRWARLGLYLGAALFFVVLLMPAPSGMAPEAQKVAAVAVLMATWWMTEALPLPATSLIPIVLFPLLGVMSTPQATQPYANDLIYLFMGGFFIALAMERWGLHRRIALNVVAVVGTDPKRLLLGFMLATGFLSAWISNTATTVMMLPIGISILALLPAEKTGDLGTALMLGIAYAATIGGVATLIGTPPNAILAAAASDLLGQTVGFARWMMVGVPVAATLMPLTWLLLVRLHRLPRGDEMREAANLVISRERAGLGRMGRGERTVAVVFTLTVLAWILREPKAMGAVVVPGISTFLPMVNDSTIAILGALALFIIPVSLERGVFTLDWEWAVKIPWGILLLFGGGLSLARGFEVSGLAAWIGDQVAHFAGFPSIVLVLGVTLLFIFLTELTSNTATATMGMPILAGVAAGMGTDPFALMAAAALASSMAFMLPVGTPPNAIVFGSGQVTIARMVRAGLWLNFLAAAVVTLLGHALITAVFGG